MTAWADLKRLLLVVDAGERALYLELEDKVLSYSRQQMEQGFL